jgi:hypothetical protein
VVEVWVLFPGIDFFPVRTSVYKLYILSCIFVVSQEDSEFGRLPGYIWVFMVNS